MGSSESKASERPPPLPRLLEEPWRKVQWGEKQHLLTWIKNFRPSKEEVKQVRILLYGPVGAGKSSFINSSSTVIRGTSANIAPVNASNDDSTSFTLEFRTHKIWREESDECFPFTFSDIMGLDPCEDYGVLVEDLILMMKGHVKDGYKFNPYAPLTDTNTQFYNPKPALEDRVHLLVCVLPAHTSNIHEKVAEKIKRIKQAARDLNVPHVVLLTHIDRIQNDVKSDVKNVFKVQGVQDKIREYGGNVGFVENHFFPVRNYCTEYLERNEDMDILILTALKYMLIYANDFLKTF